MLDAYGALTVFYQHNNRLVCKTTKGDMM